MPAYKWAKTIKELDGNRCAYCGRIAQRLEAHHIKPRALYPELETDLTNGIALCHDCHWRVHRGSFYQVHIGYTGNESFGREVWNYVESSLRIVIPKGQKQAVEAHAQGKGQSVNGYVNGLIRADMGLTEDEWKNTSTE